MRNSVILQSACGSHEFLHSLKEVATDNSCSVAPGTMFCESKELIQAKIGSQIGKQVLICSSHVSENLCNYCLYTERLQSMASVTPAVKGTANIKLYQATVNIGKEPSIKTLMNVFSYLCLL